MNKKRALESIHAPYFLHKDAAIAEEMIRELRSEQNNLGRMATMLFLLEAHPEKADGWRKRYKFYIERTERAVRDYPLNSVGWNDYYMARWLIVGDESVIPEIMSRTAWDGERGDLARWMVGSVRKQIPEFDAAVRRLEKVA